MFLNENIIVDIYVLTNPNIVHVILFCKSFNVDHPIVSPHALLSLPPSFHSGSYIKKNENFRVFFT